MNKCMKKSVFDIIRKLLFSTPIQDIYIYLNRLKLWETLDWWSQGVPDTSSKMIASKYKKPVAKEPVYWNDFKLWNLRGIIC